MVSAFDGREGLEKALRFRPALIVSDIMMPKVSGVEMIAEMRRLPELQSTPVLLLSAKADEELDGASCWTRARRTSSSSRSPRRTCSSASATWSRRSRRASRSQALREAAESANRAKDEFLAMLGHELRNPLSPILTALQLMKLQGDDGSERARTVIERQVNALTRLVDDLLDVSRIARGKVELKTRGRRDGGGRRRRRSRWRARCSSSGRTR